MLPSLDEFITHMKRLDIQRNMNICVYDQSDFGMFSAPRAAFTLRYFGATNVRVLNGGMKKWEAEQRATVTGAPDEVNQDANGDFGYKKDENR
jgi:thiosulfate/3-mercaptopyruvate sulfurtransferase